MISSEQINEIVYKIVRSFQPEKVILFGSYAYGQPTEDSDLDLLIIKEMNVPRHQRATAARQALKGIKIPIDLLVYTNAEIKNWEDTPASFINDVMRKGRVLYG